MKKSYLLMLVSVLLCAGLYAQDGKLSRKERRQMAKQPQVEQVEQVVRPQRAPAPVEDVNKVVDNTLDSLNIAKTSRPVSGSSRKGDNPVLFLIGDSTMRTGTRGNGDNGQWGWGYYVENYFDKDEITVENHALGGTSSRSFYEMLWPAVLEGVRPGDWVIIQLGHNDNGPYDSGRARASIPGAKSDSVYVTIKETGKEVMVYSYGDYMRKYANEIRAKGAHPVFMTLTMRNSWNDEAGKPNMNNDKRLWLASVASEMNVPIIDLNRMTAEKYERYGKEKIATMFYRDNIHTSAFGAEDNAKTAVEGIRAYPGGLELAKYLKPAKEAYNSSSRKGDNPVIFIAGDSTVKNKDDDKDGMWGWGSVIGKYFDDNKITVDNQAMAGRSSRTYLDEGRWDKVYEALRPGDFVLIQFGHNDGGDINVGKARGLLKGSGDESRVMKMEATGVNKVIYTFGWYLRKFIYDAKEKGATPVILSHTPRNKFDSEGKMERNSGTYGLWAKEAAEQAGAYFIDLNQISADKFDKIGDRDTISTYFKNDHTHTSLKGATFNAESIAEGLKNSDIPLKGYLK